MEFSGSFVAIITPFEQGKVNREALKALIEWHIAEGTNGFVPCGTTGESATFSHAEQAEVIRLVVDTVAGRVPVIAGAGSNSTAEAVALAKATSDAGADGLSPLRRIITSQTKRACTSTSKPCVRPPIYP